ncbi:MAG: 4-alpha-glucanotransferase [Kaiparowitsia implicata GSE-PSE-MK54-09C]|jgi:4-alpha-glucanotransferase|nr:4-alpha-glucanotransferase [Kaiparowitsia implicata GSE-PSE-MK54-09C]
MPFPRTSGLLLHPTSLSSPYGIGDLGPSAYEFVDFLWASGQRYWQVLPLGPTGYGNSPYMCYSAMTGNPLLISLERLKEGGLLDAADLAELPPYPGDWVDYDVVRETKMPLLQRAAARFKQQATPGQWQEFELFCASRSFWLNDYALFMTLKAVNGGSSWHTWDGAIAQRDPTALEEWRLKLSDDIFCQKFFQFEFFHQWQLLKRYANQRQIDIIGDIPIYVAHDSADVWAFPHLFHLDLETGLPQLMAGVPPDYFSDTGQLWGNPVYHWERMQATDFKWWIERFQATLEFVDIVRIDHFRGFCAYWAVPQGEETAMNGEWLEAPGVAFFEKLEQTLGRLPILAEDLGVITPDVEALRDRFQFPGMKVLQFAFGGDLDNPFLPFNFERNFVVYTGTHDNDTTLGWYDQLPEHERQNLAQYLGLWSPDTVHWDLIRLAMSSVANQAIVPLQDVLGLGGDCRMNFPGKPEGNWGWRLKPGQLNGDLSDRLHHLTRIYGRNPQSRHAEGNPHHPDNASSD